MFVLHYVSLITRNLDVPVEETATGLRPLIKDISELQICEAASLPGPSNPTANVDAKFGSLADYIGKYVAKLPDASGGKSEAASDSDSTHLSMPGLVDSGLDSSDDSEGESEEVTGRFVKDANLVGAYIVFIF